MYEAENFEQYLKRPKGHFTLIFLVKLKKNNAHTTTFNAKALLLALLMLTAFGGKEVHILLEHSHSDLEICHVQAGETHLHAYEDLEHGCSLCDFTFSFFIFQLPQLSVSKHLFGTPTADFAYFTHNIFLYPSFITLRGPPAVA